MVYKSIYSLFFAYYTWSSDRILIKKRSNYYFKGILREIVTTDDIFFLALDHNAIFMKSLTHKTCESLNKRKF